MNIKSVTCDFKLNIIKSIDDMLRVPIFGCFFHFKQCFQRRVDRAGFKTAYEVDEYFRKFINECSALSFLPIEDIEDGLSFLNGKYSFHEENINEFKNLSFST